MTNRKNWIKLIIILCCSIIISIVLICKGKINVRYINELGVEFQYNMISMSSIIGGFLFTGISILISVIDKERIKRMWDNNYLDNLYRCAFIGMISNIVTIIIALIILCSDCTIKMILTKIEMVIVIVGIVCFVWCITKLFSLIKKLK